MFIGGGGECNTGFVRMSRQDRKRVHSGPGHLFRKPACFLTNALCVTEVQGDAMTEETLAMKQL